MSQQTFFQKLPGQDSRLNLGQGLFYSDRLDAVTLFWGVRQFNDEGATGLYQWSEEVENNPRSCVAHLGHRCNLYVCISKNLTSFPLERVHSDFILDISLEKLHCHFHNVKESLLKVENTQTTLLVQRAHPY